MAANTPKQMSSRLMTMKFMQRSAAKSASSEPSTPSGPPSKRVRLSNGGSVPGSPATPSDHEIIQSALAAEEKKRLDALDKAAEQAGETKWVLSFKDPQEGTRRQAMNVRQAGFAAIDAEDDSDDEEDKPARMQFGGGLKKAKPASNKESEAPAEDEGDSSSDEIDSDDPTAELIRETKREYAAKDREARKSQKKAAQSVDEDMDLGGLETLSGARRTGLSRPMSNKSDVVCHGCGQKGHYKDSCPNKGKGRGKARR